jgi:hypothetical protein
MTSSTGMTSSVDLRARNDHALELIHAAREHLRA